MDFLVEDSREEKNIEDYLFSGYRPSGQKSTFDVEQQFAKPIQDEDLFGFVEDVPVDIVPDEIIEDPPGKPVEPDNDLDILSATNLFTGEADPEILIARDTNSPSRILTEDTNAPGDPEQAEKHTPVVDIDDLFPDDYSDSSNHAANTRENANPVTYQKPKPTTPAQEKMKRLMERIKQQAIARQKKPLQIGQGFGEDGTVEATIEQHNIVSNTSSKLMFNKLFNKSKKNDDSHGTPERKRQTWQTYKQALRKEICAQKRKVWDEINKPVEVVDEEAIVRRREKGSDADGEDEEDEVGESGENDDMGENTGVDVDDDAESDGGIEALEREELEDSDDEQVSRKRRPLVASSSENIEQQEIEVNDSKQLVPGTNQKNFQESDEENEVTNEGHASDYEADDETLKEDNLEESGEDVIMDELEDDEKSKLDGGQEIENYTKVESDDEDVNNSDFDGLDDDFDDDSAMDAEDIVKKDMLVANKSKTTTSRLNMESDDDSDYGKGVTSYLDLDAESDSDSDRRVTARTRKRIVIDDDDDE